MSVGGSSNQSGSSSQVDPRIYDAWSQLNTAAQQTANIPFQAYGGQMAAGDNQWLSAAREQALNASQTGKDQLGEAAGVFSQIANQSPFYFNAAQTGGVQSVNPQQVQAAQIGPTATFGGAQTGPAAQYGASSVDPNAVGQVQAGSIPGGNLSSYLNPYQSSVIDQSNSALDRQRQMVQNQNAAAATAAGAFGGSRHGIVDAENNKNFAELQQQNTNNLLNAGYDRATGLMTSDLDRALAAGQTNQGVAANLFNANADRSQSAAAANAGAQNAFADANANRSQQAGLAGMDAANTSALQQAQLQQQAALANQQAGNTAQQYNAGLAYEADAANADRRQAASIANAGIDDVNTQRNLQAAQGLTDIAGQKRSQALDSASMLGDLGSLFQGSQQTALDAAYNEFLRGQQAPLDRLNTLAIPFGLQPSVNQSTSNSKSKSASTSLPLGK